MRFDVLLLLRNEQLSIIIKQSVKAFQNFSFCQVELIQYEPVPFPDSLNKRSFSEDQLAAFVGKVVSNVLLYLGVLVVVDSDATISHHLGNVSDHTGLAGRCRSLEQHWQFCACNCSEQVFEMLFEGISKVEQFCSFVLIVTFFQ